MGPFAIGEVVLLRFPFSDLTGSKLRPALLIAPATRADWIACQITSNPLGDPEAVELPSSAFAQGSLQRTSYARPAKLFTAHKSLFQGTAGLLQPDIIAKVRRAIVAAVMRDQIG